jgi:RND superfamily putative drug exporter
LTLLPAVLVLLDRRVEKFRLPWRDRVTTVADRPDALLSRWTRAVMRRPIPVTVVTVGLLLVAALPVLHLRPGIDLGTSSLGGSPVGRGQRLIAEAGLANAAMPLDVIATTDVSERIRAMPGVADVVQDATGRDRVHYSVVLSVKPDDPVALDVVRNIRKIDEGVLVGGPTAEFLDLTDQTRAKTWLVIGLVLALAFVMLMVVFRSILLPLKAVLMNLLATGAAYGLLVWGFQDGHLAGLLGFTSSGSVQAYLPATAFALVFGLSMDYEVFLVRRIQEAWRKTGDPIESVADGLRHTALPITAAAAIMAAVFGSFVTSDVLELQQIGFGLAVAVIIDAVLIRIVLVPAVMRLAGRWNWWLPGPLDRLLPRIDV